MQNWHHRGFSTASCADLLHDVGLAHLPSLTPGTVSQTRRRICSAEINREEGEGLPVWALDGSGGRKNLRDQSSVQAETQTLVSFALTDQKSLF